MAKKTAGKKRGPLKRERLTPEMLTYVANQVAGFADRYRKLSQLVEALPAKEIHAYNWPSLQIALKDVSAAVAEAYKGYDDAVANAVPTSDDQPLRLGDTAPVTRPQTPAKN